MAEIATISTSQMLEVDQLPEKQRKDPELEILLNTVLSDATTKVLREVNVGTSMKDLVKKQDAKSNREMNEIIDESEMLVDVMNQAHRVTEAAKTSLDQIENGKYDSESLWEVVCETKDYFDQMKKEHPELMKNCPNPFGDDFTKDKIAPSEGYFSANCDVAKENLEKMRSRINDVIQFAQSMMPLKTVELQYKLKELTLLFEVLHRIFDRLAQAGHHIVRNGKCQ